MKKILLSMVILMSALSANAIDWQMVDSKVPGIDVYVDMDSIRNINNNEYYYSLRYNVLGQPEKIVYIKANAEKETLGIIQSGDYEADNYRPNYVFAKPHAYMKPVEENSFLYYVNDYVASITLKNIAKQNEDLSDNEYYVSYSPKAKEVMTPAELEAYMIKTSKLLKKNWNPPKAGYTTRTIVNAEIGEDGSLQSYKIINSSNKDNVDRSVISALEKAVPYCKYNAKNTTANSLNFQYAFINNVVGRTVKY